MHHAGATPPPAVSTATAVAALLGVAFSASAQTTATLKPVMDFRADWMGLVAQSPGGRHLQLSSYAGDTLFTFDRDANRWSRVPDASLARTKWAPNGRFVAHIRRGEPAVNTWYVWLTPMDSATATPSGPARRVSLHRAQAVTWSNDSRRIAYLSNESGKLRLIAAPFSGGDETILFEAEGFGNFIDWTRDGASIVFGYRANPTDTMRTMRYDFSTRRAVAGPVEPGLRLAGFSRDGKHIAFADSVANRIVVRRVSDFQEVQRVSLPVRQALEDFTWSERDDHTILAVERYVPSHLHQVEFATGRLTALMPTDSVFVGRGQYSPDASRIAFLRGNGVMRSVQVMNRDGSGLRTLSSSGAYSAPLWSPSGDALVFCDVQSVHVVNLVTGQDRVLAHGDLVLFGRTDRCGWRSDGKAVRYLARNLRSKVLERQLREVTLAGADRIVSRFGTTGAIQMLDDTTLLFNDGRGLVQRHAVTGKEQRLYTGVLSVRRLFRSPDGTSLAISVPEGDGYVPQLLDLRTRAVRRVPYTLGGEVAQIMFHPDGRHLLLEACLSCKGDTYVEKWDAVMQPLNGDPARVLTAPLRTYKDFEAISISSDGRWGVLSGEASYNTRVVSLTLPPLK